MKYYSSFSSTEMISWKVSFPHSWCLGNLEGNRRRHYYMLPLLQACQVTQKSYLGLNAAVDKHSFLLPYKTHWSKENNLHAINHKDKESRNGNHSRQERAAPFWKMECAWTSDRWLSTLETVTPQGPGRGVNSKPQGRGESQGSGHWEPQSTEGEVGGKDRKVTPNPLSCWPRKKESPLSGATGQRDTRFRDTKHSRRWGLAWSWGQRDERNTPSWQMRFPSPLSWLGSQDSPAHTPLHSPYPSPHAAQN